MQPTPPPKPPIVVRAYGLVPFTKHAYTILQASVLALSLACLLASIYFNWDSWLFAGARTLLIIIFSVALVGEIIEALAMLWRFRVNERRANP